MEHVFSKAGYIVSKLRARLSPDNVNRLVFLARNENLYFEVRLVEFHKRCLNMQAHILQFLQLLHELCLAIIAQDISIIVQHYCEVIGAIPHGAAANRHRTHYLEVLYTGTVTGTISLGIQHAVSCAVTYHHHLEWRLWQCSVGPPSHHWPPEQWE